MEIIKPKVELEFITPNALKFIEKIGRTCYCSFDKITEESAEKFCKMIKTRNHMSVLEHASATFRLTTDRGVTHEVVRHRIAAYSQECLTGDTVIHPKGYTIKQLYDRFTEPNDCYTKTHNKTIRLKSCDENNNIVFNKVLDVLYKGLNPVYEVTTELGYKIKTTLNHEFLTQNHEFKKLSELQIGDYIMVNGRKCLLTINDDQLIKLYETLSVNEIADLYNCPYGTVLRRLKQLGIFESHKNDKDLHKYNKNHTDESYKKMSQTIKEQYKNGRIVWNKWLNESNPSVKKQGDALRKYHHNNKFGKDNSNYKTGIGMYKRLKEDIVFCEICGSDENLEVHHLDKNRNNNELSNLIKVCRNCHRKFHYSKSNKFLIGGTTCIRNKIISINYIGIEDTYDIVMESPYNNFVANGFIVHNSTRYINYNKKFGANFIEPAWIINSEYSITDDMINRIENTQYTVKHILNDDTIDNITKQIYVFILACYQSEQNYNAMINLGATPQNARAVLINALKTELVMTANFREWLHFLDLRTSTAAHPDMRIIANQIGNILNSKYPMIFEQKFA